MTLQKTKQYLRDNLVVIIAFLAASALACVLMFTVLSYDYIDYDSSYQYALTQHDIPEIFRLLPYDYSPPFYAIALKLYSMVFGNSLFVMRTFSLVAVVGMLFVAAFPVNDLFGKRSALICVSTTLASGIMLTVLTQIRPTIFAMFFYMAAAVYAVTAYIRQKRYAYICFTVFSVLSMYTHNIALVGVFCIYVVLLAACLVRKNRKKLRYFFISGCICAVLYIPWLGVLLGQVSNVSDHFWTARQTILNTVSWFFTSPLNSVSSLSYIALTLIFGAGLLIGFLKHIRFRELKNAKKIRDAFRPCTEKEKYSSMLLLALFLVAAIIMLELVNLTVRNITTERYCAIIGTAWIVMSSALLGSLGNHIVNIIVISSIMMNQCINIASIEKKVKETDRTAMVSTLTELCTDGKISFLHTNEITLGLMSYYFPDADHYVCSDTFTVLKTYDVFPVNVVDISDYHSLWQYTDNCIFPHPFGGASDSVERVSYDKIIQDLSDSNGISESLSFRIIFNTSMQNCNFTYISVHSDAKIGDDIE